MGWRSIWLGFSALVLGLLGACEASEAPVAALPQIDVSAGDGPALWALRDEDTVIYLFGTVHLLKPGTNWETDKVLAAFNAAETVWFETPMSPNPGTAARLVSQLGFYPRGETLADHLTTGERELVETTAIEVGLTPAYIMQMRPWMAGITLSMAALSREGYELEEGIERQLEPRAEKAGKTLRYFETLEEQLRFLADLPDDVQLAFLRDGLGDLDEASDLMGRMDSAWLAADLETLGDLLFDEMSPDLPIIYEVMIRDRNVRWVDVLAEEMDTPGVSFVAVGAGHLVGEDSVVTLLRARGFTVDGP